MRPCSNKFLSLGIVGLLALFFGSTLHILWPKIFHAFLSKELPLKPNSRVFEIWKDTEEIPMTMNVYLFNWTNPEELKLPGKKPNLVQVGPYSFIHKTEKVDVIFHPENNTVSYYTRKYWYFDPSKSNGTLEDQIFHLNVVAVTAAKKVESWSNVLQNTISFMLNKLYDIHVVKTVDELLFKGYDDPIISIGQTGIVGEEDDNSPYDKFGWFYLRNGTSHLEGHFNMETGEDDINKIGKIKTWNYMNATKFYNSPCNRVQGSAGEFWPPGQDENDVHVFTADLCRTVIYEYSGSRVHHGIAANHYEIGDKTLANDSSLQNCPHQQDKCFTKTKSIQNFFVAERVINKINDNDNEDRDEGVNMGKCFCNGECSPMGVVNVTACRYGAPGFISLPHFYKADPILRSQVNGMNPNPRDHSFYIDLEPTTGIPLDVAARLQINILIQPSETIDLLKNVPKIFLPILWFEARGGATDKLAASLRQVLLLNKIGLYGSVIVAYAGGILVIIWLLVYLKHKRDSNHVTRNNKVNDVRREKVYRYIETKNEGSERDNHRLYADN